MNTAEIEQELRDKLATLQARLTRIEQDAAQSHSSDFSEQAQERENDEVLDGIGNETRASINQVIAAIQRLEAGEYGTCMSCSQAIEPDRLKAIPEVTQCVACASGAR